MGLLMALAIVLAGCEKDVQEARKSPNTPMSSGPTFQAKAKDSNQEKQGARRTANSPVNLFPQNKSTD